MWPAACRRKRWGTRRCPPPRSKSSNSGFARAQDGNPTGRWFHRAVQQRRPCSDRAWVSNPIDAFILKRLESEGLAPSAEADRATLIRRVTLDLTGLPPTPEDVDAFLADRLRTAYEKVVDRLLASPRYGERMAFRWLDAARYADTNGYQNDGERYMWRWRDWVIDAFNRNMPFDQFTVEQLAGDLLPERRRWISASPPASIAITAATPRAEPIPKEYQVEYVVDRVETTSHGVARADDGLRPLPRPQVRSHPAKRFLPVLRLLQQRLRPGRAISSTATRRRLSTRQRAISRRSSRRWMQALPMPVRAPSL